MRSTDVLNVLDAAYRIVATPGDWLRGVIDALAPHLDSGSGVCGYFVDASDPAAFHASGYDGRGAMMQSAAVFQKWAREVPVAFQRHVHLFGPCGYGADIPQLGNVVVKDVTAPTQIPDMLGINALDATGRGCAFAAAQARARTRKLGARRVRLFSRIASHIAAGARIGQTQWATRAQSPSPMEAIVAPGGKIAHATGAARDTAARHALAQAAVHIDRARTRHSRLAPDQVTELWAGLVGERWSLVDHFERDGRRYFIAYANAPRLPDGGVLSQREAQVAGAAAIGHTTKLIAYELGISPSSVATHLARAARKLGVRSRVELVRAFTERGSGR